MKKHYSTFDEANGARTILEQQDKLNNIHKIYRIRKHTRRYSSGSLKGEPCGEYFTIITVTR